MKSIQEIITGNESIDSRVDKHWKEQSELRQLETESIHDMVEIMGGQVEVDYEVDESPVITYDGGRHAEYNSTICAVVTNIKAIEKRGFKMFSVDLEECEDYESDRINFDDIDQIYNFVCGKFEDFVEEQKNADIDEIGQQD